MKAKIPEPVGKSINLYDLEIENTPFEIFELEELLKKMQEDLDEICIRETDRKRISLLDYQIIISKPDYSEYLCAVAGGSLLLLKGKDRSEEVFCRLREEYAEGFKQALKKFKENPCPLNVIAHMVGAIETVLNEIEIKDPF